MIGIGVIGYGYWGPNLVRNFHETPGARVVAVCDTRAERQAAVQERYPAIGVTARPADLWNDPAVDAVVIATPVSTHFDLAMDALRAGRHVLVEKPMTAAVEEGRRLLEEADRRGRVLMVGHTFVYMGAVRKIKEIIGSGGLGAIYYYDAMRVNLGLFQHDVNVIWDLAVHDLSILDHVLESRPVAVSATGISHLNNAPENTAYLTLFFSERMIAHINVNWLSPVKLRQTLIAGSRKMIVFDDLEPSEKVKVYDSGINVDDSPESIYQMLIGYRTGDMWSPQCDRTEALRVEARDFIHSIEGNCRPVADGAMGLRVVRVLEAATQSVKMKGRLVELAP
jgi:predicted dehydrogenase